MLTEAEVERLFLTACKRFGEDEDRRNELHLTDLTSECPRKVWFEKRDPWPDDPEGILRMWEGKAMHEASPLLEYHELELELDGVKTKIDEYGNGILIEKKFVNFMPKDKNELQKYYSHYILQVNLEALFLVENGYEFKQAFLLFSKRGEQDEKGRKPLKAFDVTEFVDLEEAEKKFKEAKEYLQSVLSQPEPPPIPPSFTAFDYPCSYCKYRARCWIE